MAIDINGWCAAAEQPRRAKLPYSRMNLADEPCGFHIKHFRLSTSRRKDDRSARAVWYFAVQSTRNQYIEVCPSGESSAFAVIQVMTSVRRLRVAFLPFADRWPRMSGLTVSECLLPTQSGHSGRFFVCRVSDRSETVAVD